MSGQTASPARIVKYNTVFLFMCLFSLLFVAMGGVLWRRWCIFMSQGKLWPQKFPSNYVDDFTGVVATWVFFHIGPRASSRRWKMSSVTTFDGFILQRLCTFITFTRINDTLPCKLHGYHFFFFFFLQPKQNCKLNAFYQLKSCTWYISQFCSAVSGSCHEKSNLLFCLEV